MKPIKTTFQILFALSLILLTAADCNGPTPPEDPDPPYDGPWEKVEVPDDLGNYALDFLAPNDGWVAGYGNVGHWDGSSWSIVGSFEFGDYYYIFSEIYAESDSNIWVAGTKHWGSNQQMGAFVHFDGNDWIIEDFPALEAALTVWMFDDGTGWGGGAYGVYYYNGSNWTEFGDFAANTFFFNSKTDGWACGLSKIYRWDGTEWTEALVDYDVSFNDIYFTAPDDGWAVSKASLYGVANHYHWDGANWTKITDETIEHKSLDAVHFLRSDWGWAIGPQSYFYNGNEWIEYELPDVWGVYDIYCLSETDVWVSCSGPDFAHFPGFNG